MPPSGRWRNRSPLLKPHLNTPESSEQGYYNPHGFGARRLHRRLRGPCTNPAFGRILSGPFTAVTRMESNNTFHAAHAHSPDWLQAVNSCLAQLDDAG